MAKKTLRAETTAEAYLELLETAASSTSSATPGPTSRRSSTRSRGARPRASGARARWWSRTSPWPWAWRTATTLGSGGRPP